MRWLNEQLSHTAQQEPSEGEKGEGVTRTRSVSHSRARSQSLLLTHTHTLKSLSRTDTLALPRAHAHTVTRTPTYLCSWWGVGRRAGDTACACTPPRRPDRSRWSRGHLAASGSPLHTPPPPTHTLPGNRGLDRDGRTRKHVLFCICCVSASLCVRARVSVCERVSLRALVLVCVCV